MLRRALLREFDHPVILETHGGMGRVYAACYERYPGAVFELAPDRVDRLARQRPNWAVYEGDAATLIEHGAGSHLPISLFDIDPYGSAWPFVDAIFAHWPGRLPDRWGLVGNDGIRQYTKLHTAWRSADLAPFVERYGNERLYRYYREICEEAIAEKAAQAGYALSRWTSYYCGHALANTHYAAVFTRDGGVSSPGN